MVTLGEIQRKMQNLKAWSLEGNSIVKDFTFPSFRDSVDFVNKIAELAEKFNHHPDIIINYNNVHLSLTTHSEATLTEKDFFLAEEIDKIL